MVSRGDRVDQGHGGTIVDPRQRYVLALSSSVRRAMARSAGAPTDKFWRSAVANLLVLLDHVMEMSPNDARFNAAHPQALRAPWDEMVRRALDADPSASSFGQAVVNHAEAIDDTSHPGGVISFTGAGKVRARRAQAGALFSEHPHQVGDLVELVPGSSG